MHPTNRAGRIPKQQTIWNEHVLFLFSFLFALSALRPPSFLLYYYLVIFCLFFLSFFFSFFFSFLFFFFFFFSFLFCPPISSSIPHTKFSLYLFLFSLLAPIPITLPLSVGSTCLFCQLPSPEFRFILLPPILHSGSHSYILLPPDCSPDFFLPLSSF